MERRYGYFRCKDCKKSWESSQVYCKRGTLVVRYQQDCKDCKTPCFPYKTEKMRCSVCGNTDCTCTKDDLDEKRRHVDPNKPHRADLCHKCRDGKPCKKTVCEPCDQTY
ncbi:zygote arrest protein 2.S-like [Littorina saxatilis]|uniref:3CxxC-type domain-containing protein n=1 Tax=Littorina saxatilis TaxID=31220 RepID=A0AAN9GJF2_9CAEN